MNVKREQTLKTLLDKSGTGTNYIEIERDGRLNMVACSNYFVKNPLYLPGDFLNIIEDKRVRFYAFTCIEHSKHSFYQSDASANNLYDIERMPYGLDKTNYLYNHGVIMKFLREIERSTKRVITNIHILYNATSNDDTNGVFPWHDDRNFAEGKDTRQMAILLTEGNLTEFAIGNEPGPHDAAENILKCFQTTPGWGTYWRNPIIHRKPLQPERKLRAAVLLVFDFFYGDEKHIDSIFSNIKHITDPNIQRRIHNEMTELIQMRQARLFHNESSVVIQGGNFGFVRGSLASVKKEPPVNCLESDHPSCSDMFGGETKYKYKGRLYKLRYGKRGGRYILVNGVVKYV